MAIKCIMQVTYEKKMVEWLMEEYSDVDQFIIFCDVNKKIPPNLSAKGFYKKLARDDKRVKVRFVKGDTKASHVSTKFWKEVKEGDKVVICSPDEYIPKLGEVLDGLDDAWFAFGIWMNFIGDYRHVVIPDDATCLWRRVFKVPRGGFKGFLFNLHDTHGNNFFRHSKYSSKTVVHEPIQHYRFLVRPNYYYRYIRCNSNRNWEKSKPLVDERFPDNDEPCDAHAWALEFLFRKKGGEIFYYDLPTPAEEIIPREIWDMSKVVPENGKVPRDWGEIQKWTESRFYPHDPSKYRIVKQGLLWSQAVFDLLLHHGWKKKSIGFRDSSWFTMRVRN